MSEDERQELIDAGAAARAAGRSFLANPAYRPSEDPRHTGELRERWLARVNAWHVGWELENAVRTGAPDPQVADMLRRMARQPGNAPGA